MSVKKPARGGRLGRKYCCRIYKSRLCSSNNNKQLNSMRRPALLALCSLPFALSACMTPTTPQLDAQFGKATRSMFAQQIENPEASKNTAVPVGMAAEAMSGLNNYRKSFGPQVQAISSPRSGGNSSGGGGDMGPNWRNPASNSDPIGGIGPNGEFIPGVPGGAIDKNGGYMPDIGPGYLGPNGMIIPKVGP